MCESEPGVCGVVDYLLAVGFHSGEESSSLQGGQFGQLGPWGVGVDAAYGFENSACGEYGALRFVRWVVAATGE